MKIAAGSADRFAARPDPKIRAVLVYGPDEGLVGERGRTLAQSVCPDLNDAFRVVELSGAQLKDDPARLADEVQAIALMGGRRVIRVRPAGEESVAALQNALEAPASDALIVLEAGDLKKSSKLRKLAEDADSAAALPCYADDARALDGLVEQTLASFGLRATPEAQAWLVDNLGGDRGVSRRELEKLALYVGIAGPGASASGVGSGRPGANTPGVGPGRPGANIKEITIDDCLAIVGDSAEITLQHVALAAAEGDQKALDRALDRVFAEGTSAIPVLRALARHLIGLHQARAAMQAGMDARGAVDRLRPPPHFAVKPRLVRQLSTWSADRLGDAITLLLEAEMQCKTTGMPAEVIARRACMRVANAANVSRARKRA